MDGLGVQEVGRSINGSGSRSTGVTICLTRLGAAVRIDGARARGASSSPTQPLEAKAAGASRSTATPAARPRRRNAKGSDAAAAAKPAAEPRSNQAKGAPIPAASPAAEPRKRKTKGIPTPATTPAVQPRKAKAKGHDAPASRPAVQPRKRKAEGKEGTATKAKAKTKSTTKQKHVPESALNGKVVLLGAQSCSFGQDDTVLRQIIDVARRSQVNEQDAASRAQQYMQFLSALPACLALGEYTKKHLCRKHLIQHYVSEPRSFKGISLHNLLDILPDVGNHLADLPSPSMTASRWAGMLSCQVMHLSMWPCLLSEALARVPHAADILWGVSRQVLARVLQRYREEHGFNPSPKVLLAEVAKSPEGRGVLASLGVGPPSKGSAEGEGGDDEHNLL